MVTRVKGLAYPKHVTEDAEKLARALNDAFGVHLFLDYGGTLVEPGVGQRERPAAHIRRKLARLCRSDAFSVYVMSSRSVHELREVIGVPGLGLIGQGGLEIWEDGGPLEHPVDIRHVDRLLHHLELDAHRCLGDMDGVTVENSGFSLRLDTTSSERAVAREATHCFETLVRALDTSNHLEVFYGDGVMQARPAGWHKGHAIEHVLRSAEEDTLIISMGDDVTDEDAFEAVVSWDGGGEDVTPWYIPQAEEHEEEPPGAFGILVSERPRPSHASLYVRNPHEVYEFLSSLETIAAGAF
ncbi:MAG: trehalose-phosphatase [Candidatus Eisenbacteria bacterium]|nr:trehalose-phosphatase [Candidatus Eisenbacteria bacterium]